MADLNAELHEQSDEISISPVTLASKMSKEEGENLSEGDRSVGNNKMMNKVSKDETAEGMKDNADGLMFSVSVFKSA